MTHQIIEITCREIAEEVRNKLLDMGFEKDIVRYGIFEKDEQPHVVVIIDKTKQLFRIGGWILADIRPTHD